MGSSTSCNPIGLHSLLTGIALLTYLLYRYSRKYKANNLWQREVISLQFINFTVHEYQNQWDIKHTKGNIFLFFPPHILVHFCFLVSQEILSLEPDAQGVHMNEILRLCRVVVEYSVQTCHPHFKNQLYGGTDPYGLAGAWLAEALNTNMWAKIRA
jgi:hypothetical protein